MCFTLHLDDLKQSSTSPETTSLHFDYQNTISAAHRKRKVMPSSGLPRGSSKLTRGSLPILPLDQTSNILSNHFSRAMIVDLNFIPANFQTPISYYNSFN